MKKLDSTILSRLSKNYGDAFYILDTEQFALNYKELNNAFYSLYSKFNIAYSYKTNYIPRLCKIINVLNGYAEVVSDMEYAIAKKVGVKSSHIIFNGPYKDPNKLEKIMAEGVTVNIDSLHELQLIEEIAARNPEIRFSVGVRCNFDINDGILSRFGIDIESAEFATCFSRIKHTPNLFLAGIHCHYASRNLSTWPARAENMIKIVKKYCDSPPSYISLGGGIYGKMKDYLKNQFETEIPTYKEYAEAVCHQFIDAFGMLPEGEKPTLLIEPGSALVGDCMKFVARVKSIKCIRGKAIATLSGSIYNINPTLNKKNPPIEVISMGINNQKNYTDLDFGGFTCIESDYMFKHFNGDLAVGDFLIFENIGSYSVVLKPPFILPNFPILELVENDCIKVNKRQENFEDIFQSYHFE